MFGAGTTGQFGTTQSTFPSGSGITTGAPTSGFSFGLQPQQTSLFSGTTASQGFGFGSGSTTTKPGGFSFNTTGTGGSLFPSSTANNKLGGTGGFSFGSSAQTAPTGFGLTTNTAQTTGNFLGNASDSSTIDQNALAQFIACLTAPQVFNDERDGIITTFNQMQAFWGTGKGYYSSNGAFLPFTKDNMFCKMRSVGYNAIPTNKPEDGLVIIVFDRAYDEVAKFRTNISEAIHRILGSKPNVSVHIEQLQPLGSAKTEAEIYVLEKSSVSGTSSRKVPSTELCAFLEQASIRQQLTSQLAVSSIMAKTGPSEEMLKDYLAHPPAGIDPFVWNQAKKDNPDPEKFIPVPMLGFEELRQRTKVQQSELDRHKACLESLNKTLMELKKNNTTIQRRVDECVRTHHEQAHRLLLVMSKQEVNRKQGVGIQPEEERLRGALEEMCAQLASPQLRGRLNRLVTEIKQPHVSSNTAVVSLDDATYRQLSETLVSQQQCISHLISVLNECSSTLEKCAPPATSTATSK